MARAKSPKPESVEQRPTTRVTSKTPQVIVDFIFERGLFFIAVKNISEQPAYKVSVKFNQKLIGLGGAREVSALPLFRNIEFLAPHKEIATFLDGSDSYFARKQPTKVEAQISYRDAGGAKQSVTIAHDLEIYRNLALAGRPEEVVISDAETAEGDKKDGAQRSL